MVGDYALSCTAFTVVPGTTGSTPCTITPSGGFTGTLKLRCIGDPSGMSPCSVAPTEVTVTSAAPVSSTLSFTPSPSMGMGSTTLLAGAYYGSVTRTTLVSVVTPTFNLLCSTHSAGYRSTRCTVRSFGGPDGTVHITCTGPPEVGCYPPPMDVRVQADSTAEVEFSLQAAYPSAGTYEFNVQATSGAISRTATFQITVS